MPHSTNHDPADQLNHHHTTPPKSKRPSKPRRPAPGEPQHVPLAVWFVPADPTYLSSQLGPDPADSWELPPLLAEKIVSDYANPGSTVLAVGGGTASVADAAARLDCRTPARPDHCGQPASVDLLILILRRELAPDSRGSADGSGAWRRWGALLAPRGILAVVLPPGRPPEQPAAVVAAAVGVGLSYLQHIPTVLWTPGEDHLTPPNPHLGVLSQLWRPGHDATLDDLLPAHADVLLFTAHAQADPGPAHRDPSADRSADRATGGNR